MSDWRTELSLKKADELREQREQQGLPDTCPTCGVKYTFEGVQEVRTSDVKVYAQVYCRNGHEVVS